MPEAVARFGGGILFIWLLALLLLAVPLLAFDLACSLTLRGTPAASLRRISRHMAIWGHLQSLLCLVFGMLLLMLSIWSLAILLDGLTHAMIGGAALWTGHGSGAMMELLTDPEGNAAGVSSIAMLPMGGVLMIGVLIWLLIHRLIAWPDERFRPYCIALVIGMFGSALLGLGLMQFWPVMPFTAPPDLWAGSSPSYLAMVVEAISWIFCGAALGAALLGQSALRRSQGSDVFAGALWALGLGGCAFLAWLFASGVLLSIGGLVLAGPSLDDLRAPLQTLLFGLPQGLFIAGGEGWLGHLLAAIGLSFLFFWSCLSASYLLRVVAGAWERDYGCSASDARNAVVLIGLLSCLVFAHRQGLFLWMAIFDSLRYLALPGLSLLLLVLVNQRLGLRGLADHLRSYSVIPIPVWWSWWAQCLVPVALAGYLCLALLYHFAWWGDGWQDARWRLAGFVSLLLVISAAWMLHQRGLRR
ncbi:MAG: hypothetical protein EA402_14755 [Planctomycetota bacterium]|nr:MAG: hypothetical protein EA402_14755 [Planctomycetota bacterium]